jgi:single-stranded DNA-binding protein
MLVVVEGRMRTSKWWHGSRNQEAQGVAKGFVLHKQ